MKFYLKEHPKIYTHDTPTPHTSKKDNFKFPSFLVVFYNMQRVVFILW